MGPLDAARHLAESGVPLFLARPDSSPLGFALPRGWERTQPDPSVVDRWQPGWALCAVTGHVVDVIDIDPRNGGTLEALREALGGELPRVYGRATTPSGGEHYLVASLGVRKLQNVVPGVDLQAGNGDGSGRGFVFLSPTVRESKEDGEPRAYEWVSSPDLGYLLVDQDDSGAGLVGLATEKRNGPDRSDVLEDYDGPRYEDLDEAKQKEADEWVDGQLRMWEKRFEEVRTWPEGKREEDGKHRGWEGFTFEFAWALAKLSACPWTLFDETGAELRFHEILPPEIAEACPGKWWDGIVQKAADEPVSVPPWVVRGEATDDFARSPRAWPDVPSRFNDAYLCAWMAHKGLGGDWCWSGGLGWMNWDGRRWVPRGEEETTEAVRQTVLRTSSTVLASGDADLIKAVTSLLSSSRIRAIVGLMKGVVAVPANQFDQQHDLLNVGNGVVDLRNGELLPHDRTYYMTKITETEYDPEATHEDWSQCLAALEPEVMGWMQVRFGQAATGWPTSDDIMPVGVGGGSNGKTTFLAGLFTALGDYMVPVPDKLLVMNPNESSGGPEMMSLFGARVAIIEETPEAGQLNVQRLKSTLGAARLTARSLYKDLIIWEPTHSLFLTSNYVPQIRETDHGTWRRLALVRFSRQFPKKDSFRANVTRGDGGRREAALAWVVEGARRWYRNGKMMPEAPERVERDTRAWRGHSDLLLSFMDEGYLEFDPSSAVVTNELLFVFNRWLVDRGHSPWSANTLASRIAGHDRFSRVKRSQTWDMGPVSRHPDYFEELPKRPWVWRGLRWPAIDETAGQSTET